MTDDEIFEPQAEPEKNILRVEIRCMTPPSEVQRARLRALLLAEHGADDVEFVIRRDETVGDGFNIFVGDDNYDWSTLGRVRQLRRSMQALPREKQFDGIISLLREDIRGFALHSGHQQVGQVQTVGDGIAVRAVEAAVARYGEVSRSGSIFRSGYRLRRSSVFWKRYTQYHGPARSYSCPDSCCRSCRYRWYTLLRCRSAL